MTVSILFFEVRHADGEEARAALFRAAERIAVIAHSRQSPPNLGVTLLDAASRQVRETAQAQASPAASWCRRRSRMARRTWGAGRSRLSRWRSTNAPSTRSGMYSGKSGGATITASSAYARQIVVVADDDSLPIDLTTPVARRRRRARQGV